MSKTYRALLRGDQIEWVDPPPKEKANEKALDVTITVLGESPDTDRATRGRKMAEILSKLANEGGMSRIKDPVSWQREIRSDRPLPGRE